MKALILAAGKSLRFKPIEDKNFLRFFGKPLLQHQLEQLARVGVTEFLVIGREHNLEEIKALVLPLTKGKKITIRVLEQKDSEGMAGGILAARLFFKKGEAVLIVNANDILEDSAFSVVITESRSTKFDGLLLAQRVKQYFPGGYLKVNKTGLIEDIVEKPGEGHEPSDLVNIVVHYHKEAHRLFDILEKTSSRKDDRYEVALAELFKEKRYKAVLYEGLWHGLKYPGHTCAVMNSFFEKWRRSGSSRRGKKTLSLIKKGKYVEIAKSSVLKGGPIVLEEGVKIMDHSTIIGPCFIGKNTVIAANCLVRGSHIGENCVIGFNTEVARSYMGNNVWTHTNYIGDSIIGHNCSFGAGTVTGNLRLDEGSIHMNIQGEKVDTDLKKFGLITGNNIRCGINTSFMPGLTVGNNCFIGAGVVVSQNVEDNKYVYGKTELVIKENKVKKLDTRTAELKKKFT